ncbi:unnamed protein product [Hydatigera taeniaeformis]|uniref:Vps39_2 domain-containing protein n=1 Tax=Hydatigena taeniaeformis TaxID=6205 RepID=A0A158REB8_HYDTA|nr:unnamed protein product [Hydatigera taeniaeformis]
MQLVFEEVEDQKTCYSFSVVFSRQIVESAIILLQASQYAELIVALSDKKLRFFDAEKLECSNLRSTMDGVSTFSIVDSNLSTERHSILAVCNENHILHVYRVLKSRLDLVNTVNLPSLALAVRCLDSYAIIATHTKYLGVNLKTKTYNDIFDRSGSRVQPLIESVSKSLTQILSINQQKQIQTLVVENVCAACISLNRSMIFVVSHDAASGPRIRVVRPETWDLEAKRLILAGCLSDVSDLIHKEYAKLVDLCNHRPATSSGAKNIFNARSRRVYTLMGFYLFEMGQLTQSRGYFEKSSLDIRELLCRYVDLLPRNYDYSADPNLNMTALDKAVTDTSGGGLPRNIFDLSEILGISVNKFRKFLLDFLLENRRGKIFCKHIQGHPDGCVGGTGSRGVLIYWVLGVIVAIASLNSSYPRAPILYICCTEGFASTAYAKYFVLMYTSSEISSFGYGWHQLPHTLSGGISFHSAAVTQCYDRCCHSGRVISPPTENVQVVLVANCAGIVTRRGVSRNNVSEFSDCTLIHASITSTTSDSERTFNLSEARSSSSSAALKCSKPFASGLNVVEAAILKLCVQLVENGSCIRDLGYASWEELVSSLSNVDVVDLLLFLEEHCEHHVKALLYRWNGNVEAALDIWRSLALETTTDANFPGPGFFTDALFTTLTSPDAYNNGVSSFPHYHTVSEGVVTEPALIGSTVYAELVARHLQDLLYVDGELALDLANGLLQRLACITEWIDAGVSATTTNDKGPTFVFAPTSLLKCLLPRHPSLAENYLWCRIFKAGDKEPSRHTLLAELQMELLLKYAEANDVEHLEKQRRRFQWTLSQLDDCQTDKLLDTLKSSPLAFHFTEEYVTLLGKLKKYSEALKFLLLEKRDLNACLRFCSWCAKLEAREKVAEQSALWCHKSTNASKISFHPPTPHVYTVLVKLLICSSDKLLSGELKKLLKEDIPNLDFAEICKNLPEDWPLDNTTSTFLTRAIRSTLTRVSTSNMEVGLVSRLASASRTEAVASVSHGLLVTETSICAHCHLPLNAYGSHRPFAWILTLGHSPSNVVHLHCLQADNIL